MKPTFLELDKSDGVYQVMFVAAAHPGLVTALKLTGLREANSGKRSVHYHEHEWDYVVGAPLNEVNDFLPDDRRDGFANHFDSIVQLYIDKPHEAQWVLMVERALRGET